MNQLKKYVLGPLEKRLFYSACVLLWFSGILWLCFKYFIHSQAEFGPETHPVQIIVLKFHGAIAMVFLIILGMLLYHIPPGWRQKAQRPSGIALAVFCGILILSGWGLYYIGGDRLRDTTSVIHSLLGILLPLVVYLHILTPRWSKRK